MKLETNNESANYSASIVKIDKLFGIPEADKIQRTVVNGNNVVVSTDVKEGDIMVYFVSGTQLNADYCKFNNLYSNSELNSDTTKKGFFTDKRRVKAIKLKGVISDGILLPLDSFDFQHLDIKTKLKVGDDFTHIEGVEICKKYIILQERSSKESKPRDEKRKNKLKHILKDNQFKFHFTTPHLAKNLQKINNNTSIVITRKYHGSSLILSNLLVNKKLSFKEKILKFLKITIPLEEYGFIWSSGKPKGELPKGISSKSNIWNTSNPSYYKQNIWERAYNELKDSVEKGISLYGEIVGEGIQGTDYTYNKEYQIYIYRITYTTPENKTIEFSWEQLKSYCNKYNLEYVEEYFDGKLKELTRKKDYLSFLQEKYLNKSYSDCNIDEGICIRIKEDNSIFKLKSPNFIKKESDNQEKGIEEFES